MLMIPPAFSIQEIWRAERWLRQVRALSEGASRLFFRGENSSEREVSKATTWGMGSRGYGGRRVEEQEERRGRGGERRGLNLFGELEDVEDEELHLPDVNVAATELGLEGLLLLSEMEGQLVEGGGGEGGEEGDGVGVDDEMRGAVDEITSRGAGSTTSLEEDEDKVRMRVKMRMRRRRMKIGTSSISVYSSTPNLPSLMASTPTRSSGAALGTTLEPMSTLEEEEKRREDVLREGE